MKHQWQELSRLDVVYISTPSAKTLVDPQHGVIVMADPPGERKYWKCDRCGSHMKTSALGKMPTRVDIPFDGSVSAWPEREITGWETPEQGAESCGVYEDCDVALVAEIMAS